jgi:hypothetical protein
MVQRSGPGDSAPPPLRVLGLAAEPAATITEIRLAAPLAVLAGAGRITLRIEPWHACRQADLAGCDVLVGQRPVTARHLKLLQAAHAHGAAVVVDIDDLLTRPAAHLQSHDFLLAHAVWVERALDEADWVSVSTDRLGRALAAPARRLRAVPNHAAEGTATVLLAASDAVTAGAAFEALRGLQAARGARLRIVAIGPVAQSAQGAGLQVEAHAVMSRQRFLDFAAGLRHAVAVIPIDDSAFSACKSAVKWFDFAAAGLPVLMSDRPPYQDVVRHGQTGWLVGDEPSAWTQALAQALDDAHLRERIATAARQQVQAQHGLAHSVAAWQALLDEVAAARAAGAIRRRPLAWHQRAAAAGHDLLVGLRRANRERLARRRQPPGIGQPG